MTPALTAAMLATCTLAAHEATKRDPAAWRRLPRIGEMDDGEGGRLELRNCDCGSTLARTMAAPFRVVRQ